MLKKCSSCGIKKDLNDFYKDKTKKSNRGSWCKLCGQAHNKKKKADNKIKRAERRRTQKKEIIEYLGGNLECKGCSTKLTGIGKKSKEATFHHLDPVVKSFTIGQKIGYISAERIFKEVDKCVVVCWPCHKIIEGITEHPDFHTAILTNLGNIYKIKGQAEKLKTTRKINLKRQ